LEVENDEKENKKEIETSSCDRAMRTHAAANAVLFYSLKLVSQYLNRTKAGL